MKRNQRWILGVLLGATSLVPPSARASIGGIDIGGATGIVCYSSPTARWKDDQSQITSIELLDLHEARFPMGGIDTTPGKMDLIEPLPEESSEDYAERLLSRLDLQFPGLAKTLHAPSVPPTSQFRHQPDGTRWVDDTNIRGNIDKKLCRLANLATQSREGTGVVRVDINGRLVFHPKMSSWGKKLIYAHEKIYRIARDHFYHRDARGTRELLGALLDRNLTLDSLLGVLNANGFNHDSDLALNTTSGALDWRHPSLNRFSDSAVELISSEMAGVAAGYCRDNRNECESFPSALKERLRELNATDVLACMDAYSRDPNDSTFKSCLDAVDENRGYNGRLRQAYDRLYKSNEWKQGKGVFLSFPPSLVAFLIYNAIIAPSAAGVVTLDANDSDVLDQLKSVADPALLKGIQNRLAALKDRIRENVLGRYVTVIRPELLSQQTLSEQDRNTIDQAIQRNLRDGAWAQPLNFDLSVKPVDLNHLREKIRIEALGSVSFEVGNLVPPPVSR